MTRRHIVRLTPIVLVAFAGLARADDDDKKLLNLKPAVKGPIHRAADPDAWKLLNRTGPIGNAGDSTFPAVNLDLKTWIPLNNFPGFAAATSQSGADCWGYTSPSGREYALIGLGWGTGVVEVTNPASPTIITTMIGCNSLWHDVTVVGHYAYAATDVQCGVGVSVYDLANIDAGGPNAVVHVRDFSQGGHTTTHTLISNPDSGFLYACGGNVAGSGCVPMSLAPDATFPTFTGPGWTTQYVHEAQVLNYTSGPYAGREIGFMFAGGPYYGYTNGLAIVDFTNKAAPAQMSFVTYPGIQFCHQGWISPDRRFLYIDDELDGPGSGAVPSGLTRVFDITDLTKPRMVSAFTNGNPAIDHNQYTLGRYLYQSNYTSGIRVWDISNPMKPVEVASIDTFPEHNNPEYAGCWGNYTFPGSGTFIGSDLQRGLFVCRLSLLEVSPVGTPPAALNPGATTPISVTVAARDAVIGSVNLVVRVNGGSDTSYPMASAGGGVYNGSFPALNCADRVSYHFSATTSEVTPRTFTWPLEAGAGDRLSAVVQSGQTTLFSDNFQADQGWTVSSDAGLTSGAWVRATPLYDGGPGAVVGDADASGMCFVTGNVLNAEVSGGATRLTSPVLDLSAAPEARVSYSRWFLSVQGTTDQLITDVSNDNGANWTQVSAIGPASGGWARHTFRVADYVAPTAQVRVRFRAADGTDSVTEAGIDAFSVTTPQCACYPNCDNSTEPPILNVADFSCFLNSFAAGSSYANCDGSTTPPVLNVSDFACFLNSFAAGCP